MNIIFIPKRNGRTSAYRLSHKSMVGFVVFAVILPITLASVAYIIGQRNADPEPWALVSAWKKQMEHQREDVAEATRNASENLDALSRRIARLQAHIIRLDALGSRLTELANLEEGEFDFTSEPAVGGPSGTDVSQDVDLPEFIKSLNDLSEQIDNRAQQLSLLETLLINQHLEDEVVPAGRPILKGWTSSFFGMRRDPFTGHQENHKGIDFAGKMGSDIVTVAAGVVTWASKRYGYGNLVEINHGNGYTTRYGHCKEVLVKIGDTVKKGDIIALMGSTGRSTGPHVHFEVWKDGHVVDPMKYIRSTQ